MTVSAVGGQSALAIQNLVKMRAQLNDLQRQLSTGLKSDTYAGIGTDRGLSVSLRAQISNMSSYGDTIDNLNTRLSLTQTVLDRVSKIGSSTKSSLNQANYSTNTLGATSAQAAAMSSLDELLGLLNTQAGDRYLFSGKATTTRSVETLDHILNGNGAQAGLRQLISERNQADLGADGMGRVTITRPAGAVALTEQTGVFGLKLGSVTSSLSNATVTGPTGSPPGISVDFTGQPAAGDAITVRFTLPDGTSENVTLTATTDSPPAANQFTIGATAGDTADNFETALTGAVGTLAGTSLAAASAMKASDEFFAADINNPPQRVAGPPFTSATAMTAGTTSNTVVWYTGDPSAAADARAAVSARVDPALTVNYGTQANEDGIRKILQNVATLAAVTYSSSDPNAQLKSVALNSRLATSLNDTSGQTVTAIQAQLAGTQTTLASAKERHSQVSATLQDYMTQITGASSEEVSAQLLTLSTRLQASLQTTSMLFQINLVNYLK